jgi:NosR/NirI family nitrous oxide reductase transcriptional regulator
MTVAQEKQIIETDQYSINFQDYDPISQAVHLRPRNKEHITERFNDTDPKKTWELSKNKRIKAILKDRRIQFLLILPNQIIFWMVIILGLVGTVVPGLNFGTAITWYLWFCLVFVMMVVVGRAWCAMCPFGGFAEWLQRKTFWQRTQKALGLGKKFPEPLARWGFLLSVATFLILTWIEEYFNIAGPGAPSATAWMVVGIVTTAVAFFLIFERRTFCRYLCPLTALIGSIGATGSVAGFRTKDRNICLECKTKDCMRGGEDGYGCPWYTWPGSADSNLSCGLCTECYKACPSDNIGLFLQRPLTSVIAPKRRRVDIAIAVLLLWGLVIFQQFNATNIYSNIDNWLNAKMHFPQYPNPVDYIGIIGLVALITGALILAAGFAFGKKDAATYKDSSSVMATPKKSLLSKRPKVLAYLLPISYGLIPVIGSDYFARQLPKFFKHVLRLIPSIGAWFGAGSTHSSLYHTRILSDPSIVIAQIVVIALGTLASLWAMNKIFNRDLKPLARNEIAMRLSVSLIVLACGFVCGFLYYIMHAAS